MSIDAELILQAEARVVTELIARLPSEVDQFRQLIHRSTQKIGHRLERAAEREGVRLAELPAEAHRQLAESVTNHALGVLGYRQRARRLREENPFAESALWWARQRRAEKPGWSALAFFEHCAIDGHPLHPAAKVRTPLTATDIMESSPEWGRIVPLRVAALQPDVRAEYGNLTALLLREHPQLRTEHRAAETLIPMHPWQVRHVLPERYRAELAGNRIRLLDTTIPALPLVSYRTFAPVGNQELPHLHHLKTSLSVRLTNAVRGVSPASARTGPVLSALLTRILANHPELRERLEVLTEPAAAHFASVDPPTTGELSRGATLSALARKNPESEVEPNELVLPIGALLAPSPFTGKSILAELLDELCSPRLHDRPAPNRRKAAERFADAYARLIVGPLISLLTQYGVALEAHGENTLLVIGTDGLPRRCIVRDLGGVRIHAGRLAAAGLTVELASESALMTTDERELRNKLYYAAFTNDASQLVGELARLGGCPESELWRPFRVAAADTFERLAQDRTIRESALGDCAALLREPWPNKALLSMWLHGAVTEYTYLPDKNPLL